MVNNNPTASILYALTGYPALPYSHAGGIYIHSKPQHHIRDCVTEVHHWLLINTSKLARHTAHALSHLTGPLFTSLVPRPYSLHLHIHTIGAYARLIPIPCPCSHPFNAALSHSWPNSQFFTLAAISIDWKRRGSLRSSQNSVTQYVYCGLSLCGATRATRATYSVHVPWCSEPQ